MDGFNSHLNIANPEIRLGTEYICPHTGFLNICGAIRTNNPYFIMNGIYVYMHDTNSSYSDVDSSFVIPVNKGDILKQGNINPIIRNAWFYND